MTGEPPRNLPASVRQRLPNLSRQRGEDPPDWPATLARAIAERVGELERLRVELGRQA